MQLSPSPPCGPDGQSGSTRTFFAGSSCRTGRRCRVPSLRSAHAREWLLHHHLLGEKTEYDLVNLLQITTRSYAKIICLPI